MAHFEGWTVVVLQDGIDGTWHGFAVEQISHTIPEVRDINKGETVRSVWRMDDLPSRELAFEDVKSAITEAMKRKKPKVKTTCEATQKRKGGNAKGRARHNKGEP